MKSHAVGRHFNIARTARLDGHTRRSARDAVNPIGGGASTVAEGGAGSRVGGLLRPAAVGLRGSEAVGRLRRARYSARSCIELGEGRSEDVLERAVPRRRGVGNIARGGVEGGIAGRERTRGEIRIDPTSALVARAGRPGARNRGGVLIQVLLIGFERFGVGVVARRRRGQRDDLRVRVARISSGRIGVGVEHIRGFGHLHVSRSGRTVFGSGRRITSESGRRRAHAGVVALRHVLVGADRARRIIGRIADVHRRVGVRVGEHRGVAANGGAVSADVATIGCRNRPARSDRADHLRVRLAGRKGNRRCCHRGHELVFGQRYSPLDKRIEETCDTRGLRRICYASSCFYYGRSGDLEAPCLRHHAAERCHLEGCCARLALPVTRIAHGAMPRGESTPLYLSVSRRYAHEAPHLQAFCILSRGLISCDP